MSDLDLLKKVPADVDPLEPAARDRIRGLVEKRIATRRTHRRSPRRALIWFAAALAVGVVAAAVSHPWTDGRPVGFPHRSPDAGSQFGGQIPDPGGPIVSPVALKAAVAEFTPSIRLPEGGSFDEWSRRIDARISSGQAFARSEVALDMVFVSQCQWAQRWLNATATADRTDATEAATVLTRVDDWLRGAGVGDGGRMSALLDRMGQGDRAGIQLWANQRCAYTGAWGATGGAQDAKATGDLRPAVAAAQTYLLAGGNPSAFDPTSAGATDPAVFWTWGHMQPVPAEPGAIFIAPSDGVGISLVSVSESGTQFCAVVTSGEVIRGTTTADLSVVPDGDGASPATPGPINCTPGNW